MLPLTQSRLRAAQVQRRPLLARPGTWLLLGLSLGGALLLRRSRSKSGEPGSGATEEQVARIREAADVAQSLPLP